VGSRPPQLDDGLVDFISKKSIGRVLGTIPIPFFEQRPRIDPLRDPAKPRPDCLTGYSELFDSVDIVAEFSLIDVVSIVEPLAALERSEIPIDFRFLERSQQRMDVSPVSDIVSHIPRTDPVEDFTTTEAPEFVLDPEFTSEAIAGFGLAEPPRQILQMFEFACMDAFGSVPLTVYDRMVGEVSLDVEFAFTPDLVIPLPFVYPSLSEIPATDAELSLPDFDVGAGLDVGVRRVLGGKIAPLLEWTAGKLHIPGIAIDFDGMFASMIEESVKKISLQTSETLDIRVSVMTERVAIDVTEFCRELMVKSASLLVASIQMNNEIFIQSQPIVKSPPPTGTKYSLPDELFAVPLEVLIPSIAMISIADAFFGCSILRPVTLRAEVSDVISIVESVIDLTIFGGSSQSVSPLFEMNSNIFRFGSRGSESQGTDRALDVVAMPDIDFTFEDFGFDKVLSDIGLFLALRCAVTLDNQPTLSIPAWILDDLESKPQSKSMISVDFDHDFAAVLDQSLEFIAQQSIESLYVGVLMPISSSISDSDLDLETFCCDLISAAFTPIILSIEMIDEIFIQTNPILTE
jgi:hypothetical protein